MGSLMAGWSSPVRERGSLGRTKSVTKEGIEEYWKLKKRSEEDHLKALVSPKVKKSLAEVHGLNELQRSQSLPVNLSKESKVDVQALENCWWTRSNWAFLNEPPVIAGEMPNYKYASQYRVADLASSKQDTNVTDNT